MLQKVDFSFFTLPDSGAFLTHAPSRMSEVFALLYPFHPNVYPSLVITIVTVGPILYLIIAAHERLTAKPGGNFNRKKSSSTSSSSPSSFYHIAYIREMYGGSRRRVRVAEHHNQPPVPGRRRRLSRKNIKNRSSRQKEYQDSVGDNGERRTRQTSTLNFIRNGKTMKTTTRKVSRRSEGLLSRCVWFTCHIFLRQCIAKYNNLVTFEIIQLTMNFHTSTHDDSSTRYLSLIFSFKLYDIESLISTFYNHSMAFYARAQWPLFGTVDISTGATV